MAFKTLVAVSAMVSVCAPVIAQTTPAPIVPIVAQPRAMGPMTSLPANTEILVSMNEELTSKGGRIDEGHKFGLSVVHDVVVANAIVIPRGTPAVGEVTWLTGKGAFGKSGKMEIELRYLDLNGQRIPLTGKYRQEGEGNTVATVAGVVAAGVFAAFITGKSARIPQGRELKAFTREQLAVALPSTAPLMAPVQAIPVAAPQATLQQAVATSGSVAK